ncbi:hypothetical protein [Pseudonocardia hydrocarbonoxydans]|uniref:Uncharacterized protein n=1 Tax=Pseudonocardia hydrocarbonoxydans TaxID=76726 RepID=A0A4Y3WIT0_9PSEU|nr:hypothetical protein [Pseudonocardia hydrocarbonoxydans]GEC18694.1 hypothetical protein PHY01_09770 [Pseudonocardia hydrocarbonoxydans]
MVQARIAEIAGMQDRIAASAVAGADALLRSGAGLPRPTIHMLCAGLEPPYVGYLTCRTSLAGRDSASAVGLMGRLPAVVAATHLVIVWEYAWLHTALEPSGGRTPTGLVVVEASMTDHAVRWHPFHISPGRVEWGPAGRFSGAVLPLPVEDLLSMWRRSIDDEVEATVEMLERAGYLLRWAARF